MYTFFIETIKNIDIFINLYYNVLKRGVIRMNKLPNNVQNSINMFVKQSKKILGNRVKKIILYGSYARGDYNDSSDIDILVLTDYIPQEFYSVLKMLSKMTYDIEIDNDVILVPIINNIENYKLGVEEIPFYSNIEKEGVILSE